jgi:ketosteroid isomerase-like protein
MSTDSPRQQFESFLDEMIEGRHDDAARRLAPDVLWHLPPFAKQAPFDGREAVRGFMRDAQAAFYQPGTLSIEKHAVTWDEPFASCLATLRATTRHGGPYENRYVFFARLENGLLAEVWEMMDSLRFVEQTRAPS